MKIIYFYSKEEMLDILSKHDLFKEQIILKNAMSDFSPFPELQSDFIPQNNW